VKICAKFQTLRHLTTSSFSLISTLSAQQLNHQYATISTDAHYRAPPLKHTAENREDFITEEALFYMLDHLRPTATGLDGVASPSFGSSVRSSYRALVQ